MLLIFIFLIFHNIKIIKILNLLSFKFPNLLSVFSKGLQNKSKISFFSKKTSHLTL